MSQQHINTILWY